MDRRKFIKITGLGFLASIFAPLLPKAKGKVGWKVLPSKAVILNHKWMANVEKSYPHFDPDQQYSDHILVTDHFEQFVLKECIELAKEQIEPVIPPQFRHKIHYFAQEWGPCIKRNCCCSSRNMFFWDYNPLVS